MYKNYAGILNTKGKLTKAILEERAKEKELEKKNKNRQKYKKVVI